MEKLKHLLIDEVINFSIMKYNALLIIWINFNCESAEKFSPEKYTYGMLLLNESFKHIYIQQYEL